MKMWRFALVFVAVLACLFGFEMLHPVRTAVIHPWTNLLAQISATIMSTVDADVFSHGRVIQSRATGFGVSIEAGCNGVEAVIILVAGVLAFPAPWRFKVAGILIGFVAIQGVNLLRVISLYYLAQWNKDVFDFAHIYLWQALIMLDVLVVWMLWIRVVAKHKGATLAA